LVGTDFGGGVSLSISGVGKEKKTMAKEPFLNKKN
jgi:hypothetical protein